MRNSRLYTYDYSGYYAYVLVNGTELQVKGLMDDLSSGGIAVSHSFPSQRPAYNGRLYDFYIRLETDPGEMPPREQVYSILEKWAKDLRTGNLSAENASGRKPSQSIRKPEKRAEEGRRASKESALRAELNEHQRETRRLQRENERLLERNSSLEKRLKEQTKQVQREQFVEEAFLMVARAEEEKTALRERMSALEEKTRRLAAQTRREMVRYQREIFGLLFPDLALLDGSVDILTRELEEASYQLALGIMMALQINDSLVLEKILKGREMKQLAGATGWREVHLGKRHRLYYHDQRRIILISMKKNQEKDLNNILRRY